MQMRDEKENRQENRMSKHSYRIPAMVLYDKLFTLWEECWFGKLLVKDK